MTAPAERLLELAAACEAATGPDRALDAAITLALAALGRRVGIRKFTASLDAAMALVPEGWKLRQMAFSAPCADDRKWHLNLHGGKVGEDTFVGRGATPALALVSAALRARAQEAKNV
jgi:hypothetical protein